MARANSVLLHHATKLGLVAPIGPFTTFFREVIATPGHPPGAWFGRGDDGSTVYLAQNLDSAFYALEQMVKPKRNTRQRKVN